MRIRIYPFLVNALAAVAIASIAVGPSPSAAAAEMTARHKRDQSTRLANPTPVDGQTPASQGNDESNDAPEAADGIASFVAPASAKPADMQGGSPTIGHLPPHWALVPTLRGSSIESVDVPDSNRGLHRPPHQPNAPPRA